MSQDLMRKTIISELGLDALPAEKKDQIIEQMSNVLQQRIALKLAPELEKEEHAKALKQIGDDDPEKVLAYMVNNIPEFDLMVKNEINALKQEMSNAIS